MFQANDALHLSLLDGCDISIDLLGDVILQDTFHVWDPKKLIRQSRERRMFLFELYLVFSKEVKDSNGKAKYQYKMKMMVRIKHFLSIVWSLVQLISADCSDERHGDNRARGGGRVQVRGVDWAHSGLGV